MSILRFHSKLAVLQAALPLTDPPPRYREWLDHWFGGSSAVEVSDAQLGPLIEVTLRRAGRDLAHLDDTALAEGFSRLLDRSRSNVCSRVRFAPLPPLRKANIVRALACLYEDVLAPRLLAQPGTPLADLCLRLWEVCDLCAWPAEEPDGPVAGAVAEVINRALSSECPAIIEGAWRASARSAPPMA
jgi:hypothetical protein